MKLLLHEEVTKQVESIVNKPKGAFLFFGPANTGKAFLANEIARQINCLGCTDSSCNSCRLATSANHPDIITVAPDEKSKIGIDAIQKVRHTLSLGKHQSTTKRVMIIQDAHLMTIPAQNALLKTLEEPPSGTVIFLTAVDKTAVLVTIQSRCQAIFITQQTSKSISSYLQTFLNLPKQKSETISELSNGAVGLAVSYSQNANLLEERQKLEETANAFIKSDLLNKLLAASELAASKIDEELFSGIIISKLRSNAQSTRSEAVLEGLEAVQRFRERRNANVNSRTAFEALALDLKC